LTLGGAAVIVLGMGERRRDGWVRAAGATPSDLMVALEHCDVVGQAKGILMGKHDIDANEAFEMLTRAARAAGRPVYELAVGLIERRRVDRRCADDRVLSLG
jgi:hypothetical protein